METIAANKDIAEQLWTSVTRVGTPEITEITKSIRLRKRKALLSDDEAILQGRLLWETGAQGSIAIRIVIPITKAEDNCADIYELEYQPAFLEQLPDDAVKSIAIEKKVCDFTITQEAQTIIDKLDTEGAVSNLEAILSKQSYALSLLVSALTNMADAINEAEVPACRFLAYDSEREKILEACAYIQNSEGKPYTIRELSRKVAMNECYLKKGFKALTGKTIHEYQQDLRINKAKEMLKSQGVTVTDVALTLGYSSISHFSTAFKKITGMKPCELLS